MGINVSTFHLILFSLHFALEFGDGLPELNRSVVVVAEVKAVHPFTDVPKVLAKEEKEIKYGGEGGLIKLFKNQ